MHTHTHTHTHKQVVHQSMGFTRLWLALKSIFCPVNILALVWFLRRAAAAVNTGLIEKCVYLCTLITTALHHHYIIIMSLHRSLAFLGTCLVLYNGEYINLIPIPAYVSFSAPSPPSVRRIGLGIRLGVFFVPFQCLWNCCLSSSTVPGCWLPTTSDRGCSLRHSSHSGSSSWESTDR